MRLQADKATSIYETVLQPMQASVPAPASGRVAMIDLRLSRREKRTETWAQTPAAAAPRVRIQTRTPSAQAAGAPSRATCTPLPHGEHFSACQKRFSAPFLTAVLCLLRKGEQGNLQLLAPTQAGGEFLRHRERGPSRDRGRLPHIEEPREVRDATHLLQSGNSLDGTTAGKRRPQCQQR